VTSECCAEPLPVLDLLLHDKIPGTTLLSATSSRLEAHIMAHPGRKELALYVISHPRGGNGSGG
jgi:hypothetical protein